jgi:hypothetical protein
LRTAFDAVEIRSLRTAFDTSSEPVTITTAEYLSKLFKMEEAERAVHRHKMLDEIRSMRTDAPSEAVTTAAAAAADDTSAAAAAAAATAAADDTSAAVAAAATAATAATTNAAAATIAGLEEEIAHLQLRLTAQQAATTAAITAAEEAAAAAATLEAEVRRLLLPLTATTAKVFVPGYTNPMTSDEHLQALHNQVQYLGDQLQYVNEQHCAAATLRSTGPNGATGQRLPTPQ